MARILVIDDDEVTRRAIGAMLEEADNQVSYAANGEQGLAFYTRSPFELVIIDLVMPIKNGLQTIRELRETYPQARIVAISGVSPEQLATAEEYGALRTMVKPVETSQLLEVVDSTLRRSVGWDDVEA